MWDHQRDPPGGEGAWHSKSSGDWALAAEGNGMCPTFQARLVLAQPRRQELCVWAPSMSLCGGEGRRGGSHGCPGTRDLARPGRRCLLQRPRRLRAEPGVRPGSWMGIQDTLEGLSPARPLLTSGSHQALPPLCAAVAAETPGRSLSGLRHAPEAPLVGPGRGGAEESLAGP